jgi:hypothetical protein
MNFLLNLALAAPGSNEEAEIADTAVARPLGLATSLPE